MFNPNVQRVVEDSVAGCDGRIRVNDHIVEVLDLTTPSKEYHESKHHNLKWHFET